MTVNNYNEPEPQLGFNCVPVTLVFALDPEQAGMLKKALGETWDADTAYPVRIEAAFNDTEGGCMLETRWFVHDKSFYDLVAAELAKRLVSREAE